MTEMKNINRHTGTDIKEESKNVFIDLKTSSSTVHISPEERETLKAIDDVNHHRNLSKAYDTVEDLMAALDA